MAIVYEFVWQVLHVLLHIHRTLITWFRIRLRNWNGRLWSRALTALIVPMALSFPNQKNIVPAPGKRVGRRYRWGADGKSLEKLPDHIGLLIAEEEPRYTDIANLVVWCMAVGISYISVYDNHGKMSFDYKMCSLFLFMPGSATYNTSRQSCASYLCFCIQIQQVVNFSILVLSYL